MTKITVNAICGEIFIFRYDTITDFVEVITSEAENPTSDFSYFDAAAIFLKNEMIKVLMESADEALEEMIARIAAKGEQEE